MNSYLQIIIVSLLGATVVVNGVILNATDVLNQTKEVVNHANVRQLATVMEIYHLDHGRYPEAEGGEELVKILNVENYIKNSPLDPSVFEYKPIKNGQDYILKLK